MDAQESTTFPLACACGKWRATLHAAPGSGQRGVCYCDDCQAYAKFLGRDDITNARAGTEVVQTHPARFTFTDGLSEIRLMRLSPKGLHRWYAGCCRAPIANTFGHVRWPFCGIMVQRIAPERRAELDRCFGAPVGVQGRFAPGGCPPDVLPTANFSVIKGAIGVLARGWWHDQNRPTPFFDSAGQTVVAPEVLSAEQRSALR